MAALDAHDAMGTEALSSQKSRDGLRDVLLNHAGLYEELRKAGVSKAG